MTLPIENLRTPESVARGTARRKGFIVGRRIDFWRVSSEFRGCFPQPLPLLLPMLSFSAASRWNRAAVFAKTSVNGLPVRRVVCVTGKAYASMMRWMCERPSFASFHSYRT